MFLKTIKVLDVDICVQQKNKFIAHTIASADLTPVMPYLNSFIIRADYNPNAHSIKFIQEGIEFTLIKDQINVAKFVNRTELHELLDWVQDLINDTYESRSELTPRHTPRERPPVLTIYAMLPKTNCKQCGEASCMAFAAKLNKLEVDIEDCPHLLERENEVSRKKLEKAFA